MNAIVALLTAASVLAHAALGCCFHHSHAPSNGCLPVRPLSSSEHSYVDHGHRHHPEHTDDDQHEPAFPHRHCDEGGCVALAGTPSGTVLKATYAAFDVVPMLNVGLLVGKSSLQTDYSRLQHDLGPPLRPHLCNLVLLI
ncbi:MAG: hypothetical protein WD894_07535 [Pirellulales bacterium]